MTVDLEPIRDGATEHGVDGVAHPVLHHVNLKTTRLEEMIAWYGQAAGLWANFHSPEIAFLTNDGANHRIALVGVPGVSDDPNKIAHAGLHHTAFEFANLGELLRRYETLKAAGIRPHFCVDHGLTMSFYYEDPDGNSVELQADNFGDWAGSTEWIRTAPEFVADPIGPPVDPDALVRAFAAGLDPAEIHRRAYAGEYPPSEPPDLRLPPSNTEGQ
jgi:catechol 2,3-dioxygenase-like lactoylglutathione lyase family enzyme